MRLHCRQKPTDATEKMVEFPAGEEVPGAARTDANQDRVTFDGKSPKVQEAIELFLRWMPGKLVFTGRTLNANRCARILHVWQGFV